MPFPRKLLTEGEAVVVELRKSWLFLGWPLVAASAGVVLLLALLIGIGLDGVGLYILAGVVAVPLLWLGGRVLRWQTTSIVITTNRIIERSGVVSRQGLEVRLDRINETSYRQSLIGRIMRAGQVMVEVGGEAGVIVYDHMARPAAVQSLITEQIAALRRRQMLGFAGAAPPQPAPGGGYGSTPAYGSPVYAQPQPAPYAPPQPAQYDQPQLTQYAPPQPAQYGQPQPAQYGQPQPAPQPSYKPPAAASAAPTPGSPPASVAERLVQLDDLRKRGIVSADEYESKRQELLRQL